MCDGFFHYHFEPHQNMRNSWFVCGFQFSQCPKLMCEEFLQLQPGHYFCAYTIADAARNALGLCLEMDRPSILSHVLKGLHTLIIDIDL